MQPKEYLAVKAAHLARAAPEEWHGFLEALAVYNEVHRENLTNSPLPELPVNQGRAQALAALLKTLREGKEIADRIQRKQ